MSHLAPELEILRPARCQERQRAHIVGAFEVGKSGRILPGEAGVAELRLLIVAADLADGAVEPVDRQETE